MENFELPLNSEAIKKLLPHRYPFLLIDRITDVNVEEKFAAGYKNLTVNEEFFNGHFPGQPIMPGVLILEAMAQLSGVLGFLNSGNRPEDGYLYLFAGIDNVRFKASAYPGDRIDMTAQVISGKRGIYKVETTAKVEGKLVASATIMCAERKVS